MAEVPTYALPEHLAARRMAQRGERTVQIIAATSALICFAGSALLVGPINQLRKSQQLVIDTESTAGLPPSIALLGKLGTFRALAIDWAAIRAERLKAEGKDYEAYQLHMTVCALAPRFPKVWVNAAWNMAYNISVSQYSPESRWQWVNNGIKLLRDKGIPYNPHSVALYKELAWIYWHKIGDFLDDEHMNYKRALAVDMESVLGPPPVTLSADEYIAWFKKIVDAPRDVDRFIAADADIAALVGRMGGVGLSPNKAFLEFLARNVRPELRSANLSKEASEADALLARRLEIVTDPKSADAVDRLSAGVRSQVLRGEEYRLDIDVMYKLMAERYGPLDWRNAFAHSLYWSYVGDEASKGHVRGDSADSMNNARFILFSLQNMVTRGKMTLYPNFDKPFASYIDFMPDTRYIQFQYAEYLRLGKEQFGTMPDFKEGTPGRPFMVGFVSAMHDWIHFLFLEGGETNLERAENFYAWLRINNPDQNSHETQDRYKVTLEQFVMDDLYEQLQTYKGALGIIRTFVLRALKHFALGQDELAERSMVLAQKCWKTWMVGTVGDFNDRRKLQPPANILRDELYSFLSEANVEPLFKARLRRTLPLEFRQKTYDKMLPFFEKLCAAQKPPWELARAFAEPAGMEEYRVAHPTESDEQPESDKVEQGERYNR